MCDQQSLRSACAYTQSDQSLCLSLEYSMTVKLLTEHHLEFLRLKGGCTGSSESTHVKIPHCWTSHATAHFTVLPHRNISIYHIFTIKCILLQVQYRQQFHAHIRTTYQSKLGLVGCDTDPFHTPRDPYHP